MRRKDREITDLSVMESIIADASLCRMALSDRGEPYLVPLCFGYENRTVYVHSAAQGRKIDIVRNNPSVWLEFTSGVEFVGNPVACRWSLKYRSVMASGRAALIDGREEKRRALAVIMAHYASGTFDFSDKDIDSAAVVKILLEKMTCKISA